MNKVRYDEAFKQNGYHSAILTTFSFDPDAFEDVALVHLLGAGCRNIAVLADTRMANRAFQEIAPPQLAGIRYHLAKRGLAAAFHPKIVLQIGENQGRLMMGSANLTGGGLVGNLEAFTSLMVTPEQAWAAPVLAAALDYLREHADSSDRAMAGVLARALARGRAPWLEDVTPAREVVGPDGQRHALVTETRDRSIGDELLAFIGDDEIRRLVMISPFWDADLGAVALLQARLGKPDTALVVDHLEQEFNAEALTCLERTTVHSIKEHESLAGRRLHAKLVVACGARADYVMTGSANASRAGLYSRKGGPGNAEACLVRTEPPGTALTRLGVERCLETALTPDELRRRWRAASAQEVEDKIRDGGAMTLADGELVWRPPHGSNPGECLIDLEGARGQKLDLAMAIFREDSWRIDVSRFEKKPRLARVLFEDDVISAPVLVAALADLARAAAPPISARDRALLDAIEGQERVDLDTLDLALQLEAMQFKGMKRSTVRASSQQDLDATAGKAVQPLSSEEFFEIEEAADHGADDLARAGVLGEVRRKINSILGLSMEGPEPFPQEADPEASQDDDMFKACNDQEERPAAAERFTGDRDQGETETGPGLEAQGEVPRKRQASWSGPAAEQTRRKPSEVEPRLTAHVDRFCHHVCTSVEDPFSIRAALLTQVLILACFDEAAPVFGAMTADRPLPAISRGGGWVRLLGRALQAQLGQWKRSGVLKGKLDLERLEALGVLLFAGSFVLEAARAARVPSQIGGPLGIVAAAMTKRVEAVVTKAPAERRYVEQAVTRLNARYAHLLSAG